MTKAAAGPLPVYLVKGDDHDLVAESVRAVVHDLAGADAGLAVEEVGAEEADVGAVIDAAQTPPFLSDRRVVVAREMGRFTTEQLRPLVAYLDDPLPTTSLVLAAGGGALARSLVDAVKKTGHIVDAGAPARARERQQWIAARAREAGVHLEGPAVELIGQHLGEDVGRLPGVLRLLVASCREGARVGPDAVSPFLGEAGGVAPWELTDAIDQGDTAAALERLHRMLEGGDRHPLQVLGTLHGHFTRILRLEGADLPDEAAAARALGLTGSTYPARKALSQARRLGREGAARAITLLAQADLDLKGVRDLPAGLVLEVLVARLSRLAPRSSSRR